VHDFTLHPPVRNGDEWTIVRYDDPAKLTLPASCAVQASGPIRTVSGDIDGVADFEVVVVLTDRNQPLTGSDCLF